MSFDLDSERPSPGMAGSHHGPRMGKDEWLTPPNIINALGGWESFDLDPCAPVVRPWPTAHRHFTMHDNGLAQEWHGRIWLNPPYGRDTGHWLKRLAAHGNGVALIFARTDTEDFHRHVWERPGAAVLFFRGRLHFHHADGTRAPTNAGAPSCLVAYGVPNITRLYSVNLPGALVQR